VPATCSSGNGRTQGDAPTPIPTFLGFGKEIFSEHSLKIQQDVAHLQMKGVQ
jgi:hypothetical protein